MIFFSRRSRPTVRLGFVHSVVIAALTLFFLPVLSSSVVSASVVLDGYFIATKRCPAFQSKNKQTNPGDIFTAKDQAYRLFAINKAGGTYFQIRVEGAPVTESRWVHISCGLHVVHAGTAVTEDELDTTLSSKTGDAESVDNVLALSWQPAFCEKRPSKPECKALNNGKLPITEARLSLHGLWPQPRGKNYCGVSSAHRKLDQTKRWKDLPALDLAAVTRKSLVSAMPGTASFLHRHEWVKHGTCYRGEGGAEEYYADTLTVMDAINGSEVATYLAERVSSEVDTRDVRAVFDTVFGPGSGDRVQFHCAGDGKRVLVQELKIHLKGTIAPGVSVGDLMRNARAVSLGCPKGIIDPAGLQ